MTTRKFTLGETGDLQAHFQDRHQRDLAAHLEAELYLARLFGDGAGIRPQPTADPPGDAAAQPWLSLVVVGFVRQPIQQLGRPSVKILNPFDDAALLIGQGIVRQDRTESEPHYKPSIGKVAA